MNNWLAWALPLVALAVWILSNLIKNAQEEARRRDMRPRPPNPEQADNQRREPPRKIERPRPPVRTQPPPVRPQPVPIQDRPRSVRLPPPEPVRIVRRPEVTAEQIVVGQLVETAAVVLPSIVPSSVSVPKSNKAVQNLKALLKSKNTLATAFLLTEVFGKPKSKR